MFKTFISTTGRPYTQILELPHRKHVHLFFILPHKQPHWLVSTPISRTTKFKLNYSHYLILRHRETNELKFYYASYNNACVLGQSTIISNKPAFDSFVTCLIETDPLEQSLHARSDAKWQFESVPATTFFPLSLTGIPHRLSNWWRYTSSYSTQSKHIHLTAQCASFYTIWW